MKLVIVSISPRREGVKNRSTWEKKGFISAGSFYPGITGNSVALERKEKWGSVSTAFEAFHYFTDVRKNHMALYTDVSLPLFKGLSLSFYGSYQRIHDQLSLPEKGASLEEVLLRRTRPATSYSYYGSIGLSYACGSIYSNVVNPRLNGY